MGKQFCQAYLNIDKSEILGDRLNKGNNSNQVIIHDHDDEIAEWLQYIK